MLTKPRFPISGFPSKEGLKQSPTGYRQSLERTHFGISIKRRIETINVRGPRWDFLFPISGFPSKEGLKPKIRTLSTNLRPPHFGISIKRRIETGNYSDRSPECSKPISGFPSKEGLKPVLLLLFGYCGTCPFRDFHQKKD